jgi:hypothetical protein
MHGLPGSHRWNCLIPQQRERLLCALVFAHQFSCSSWNVLSIAGVMPMIRAIDACTSHILNGLKLQRAFRLQAPTSQIVVFASHARQMFHGRSSLCCFEVTALVSAFCTRLLRAGRAYRYLKTLLLPVAAAAAAPCCDSVGLLVVLCYAGGWAVALAAVAAVAADRVSDT